MKKYIISSLIITIIVFISIFVSIPNKDNKILSKLVKNDTLAFTVDGKNVNEMPTKGSGYIASTIKCNKGSNFIWDNDNWEIEITDMKDKDKCVINFTKDTSNSNMVTIVKGGAVTTTVKEDKIATFSYNGTTGSDGSVQTFTAPTTDSYTFEVWGAQGGNYDTYYGGLGGYSKGTVNLEKGTKLYIYVGGTPATNSSNRTAVTGGFNGGGNGYNRYYNSTYTYGQGGGGATDIRIGTDSLYARVIVAGGGGGSASVDAKTTKYGGGTTGGSPIANYGGTQTSGGSSGTAGTFGVGASVTTSGNNYKYSSGGGGGGFYGGAASNSYSDTDTDLRSSNGGGSGYVYTSSTSSSYPSGVLLNSSYYLTDAETIAGNSSFPNTTGGTETGHTGNGYAKIYYKDEVTATIEPMEINSILDLSSKTVSSDGSVTFYPKGDATLISVSGCNATIEDNKLIIKNVTSSTECKLSGTATTMYDKLLSDNPTIKTRTNLAGVYQSNNTKTLYKIQENGTDVYYFSGNAQNNWVKFGDFYWRIIRTNADGSIRLLYHGTSTDSTSAYITVDNNSSTCYYKDTSGNCLYNNKNYVNYSTSYVKKILEKWYQDNLKNKYDNFVSTSAIYCNDTSEPSTSGQFGSYTRLITNKTPTYDCSGDNVYTKDNGKLNYPIGLISVDEVSYAGGISAKNSTAYFYYNSTNSQSSVNDNWWWTMSPYMWNNGIAFQFIISGTSDSGQIGGNGITGTYAVRPVLSIKGTNAWKSGDGSSSNPYEIVTE